jgi:hypothetical protein
VGELEGSEIEVYFVFFIFHGFLPFYVLYLYCIASEKKRTAFSKVSTVITIYW